MHIHGISFFILALLLPNTESTNNYIKYNPTTKLLDATIRQFRPIPANKCEWDKSSCHPRDINCLSLKTLEYVNKVRRKNSMSPLLSGTVKQLENAMMHDKAMKRDNKLYHQKLRIVKLGCNSFFSGENVAVNHVYNCRLDKRDPAKMCVDQFIESPGHFKNLINKDHERMVMGVFIAGNGQIWCTQTFSRFTKLSDEAGCGAVPVDSIGAGGDPVPPSSEPSASHSTSDPKQQPSISPSASSTPADSYTPTQTSLQEPDLVPAETSQDRSEPQNVTQGPEDGQSGEADKNLNNFDIDSGSKYGDYRHNGWGMYASTGWNFHFKWFYGRIPSGRRQRLRLICLWRCQYCAGWTSCMSEQRSIEMDRYLTGLHRN